MTYKNVYLKKNEERRLLAGHLWLYSNEIDTQRSPMKSITAGEVVKLYSYREHCLGLAYINPHALICGRLLTTDGNSTIDDAFLLQKITAAQQLRKICYDQPFYRLVFGESDGLPGLIIDRYDQVFVVQTNTTGMEQLKPLIISVLEKQFQPSQIIFKNDSAMRQLEGLASYVEAVIDTNIKKANVEENGISFEIPIMTGQKTGWFYDHRENRARLKQYVGNKNVLDIFSYVGGWGIQAAMAGAKSVTCIDSSAKAIAYAKQNAIKNGCDDKLSFHEQDAFVALKELLQTGQKFDVIILDPPAFIKKRKDIEQGQIAYLRLNELAMQLLTAAGILISCSCSLHMTPEKLLDIIRRASLKTKHKTQILEVGHQAMDHPLHPAIPETAYLKAFFCYITES
jgi:23S rRNA (cytosine1962-C5)-methyltransferase